MFFVLLAVTLATSLLVSRIAIALFDKPIAKIFQRLVEEGLAGIWHRYVTFAAYVVGVSGGVRVQQLERYITPVLEQEEIITLTTERWTLEIYRTIVSTLQSLAWMYLVVLIVALAAYVLLKLSGKLNPVPAEDA